MRGTFWAILAIVILQAFTQEKNVQKKLIIKQIESCDDGKDLPVVVLTTRLDIIGKGKLALNAVIALRKTVSNPKGISGKLYRCRSSLELDTCEYVMTVSFNNPLSEIRHLNQSWSQILSSITPPLVVPLKKGRYVMRNASVELSDVIGENIDNLDGFYWRAKVNLYQDKERLFCIVIGAENEMVKTNRTLTWINSTFN